MDNLYTDFVGGANGEYVCVKEGSEGVYICKGEDGLELWSFAEGGYDANVVLIADVFEAMEEKIND